MKLLRSCSTFSEELNLSLAHFLQKQIEREFILVSCVVCVVDTQGFSFILTWSCCCGGVTRYFFQSDTKICSAAASNHNLLGCSSRWCSAGIWRIKIYCNRLVEIEETKTSDCFIGNPWKYYWCFTSCVVQNNVSRQMVNIYILPILSLSFNLCVFILLSQKLISFPLLFILYRFSCLLNYSVEKTRKQFAKPLYSL